MKNKVFVAVFALLIAAIGVLTFALPKKEFSRNENRYLARFPEFSWKTVRDGGFMSGLSEYIADHFVLRDGWVTLKSLAETAALKTENNGVFRGKDGYLIDEYTFDGFHVYAKQYTEMAEIFKANKIKN